MQYDVLSLENCRQMYSDAARACIGGDSDKDYQRMDRMIRGLARLSHWDKRPRSTKIKKAAKVKTKGPDTIMSQRSPIEYHWTDRPIFSELPRLNIKLHSKIGVTCPKEAVYAVTGHVRTIVHLDRTEANRVGKYQSMFGILSRVPVLSALLLLNPVIAAENVRTQAQSPDFNSEVRPVLAKYCFKCHGPDDKSRKASMRLDGRTQALLPAKSGDLPIVPGQPDKSAVVKRIFSSDDEEVMPPSATKTKLTDAQKDILKRWIAAGAEYKPHWAFSPPVQAAPPQVKQTEWPRNAIDNFILARLEAENLHPSPRADNQTLARRVYLDLIGLPPAPEEADAFAQDQSPAAYEKLVDRLLASPQYGERWARRWLDLARYADTNGYEKDRPRSIWPYRDWVINALNADMPFDQFTIQQVAGDMLPNATPENMIATGFHRNTMLNEEGGIDPLEFRFYAVADRVATTGKAWLGMTVGCAQCHTHKFDPITHREYYQLMAFLDNADEPEYSIKPADYASRRVGIEAKIAQLLAGLPGRFPVDSLVEWETPESTLVPTSGEKAERQTDGSWLLTGKSAEKDTYTLTLDPKMSGIEFIKLEALPDKNHPQGGPGRASSGNFVLNEITVTAASKTSPEKSQAIKLVHAEADFSQKDFAIEGAIDGNPKTGWAIANPGAKPDVPRTAKFTFEHPLNIAGGAQLTVRLEQQYGEQHTLGRFRLSVGKRTAVAGIETLRHDALEKNFNAWIERESSASAHWTILRPIEAKSNLPLLTVLDDLSVLASGDQTKSDTYDLKFHTDLRGITAFRLEVMPDERLPKGGPGRVYYEGPAGDFSLSEFSVSVAEKKLTFSNASHSFADGKNTAANAIDGKPDTCWSINGGQGRYHTAVFKLSEALAGADEFQLKMLFERHFCAGLGRFRISVTSDTAQVAAREFPAEIEAILLLPENQRTPEQRQRLFQQYLLSAPELASARSEIDTLRKSLNGDSFTTTLVMNERPPENPRHTFIHNRGEYLQPTDRVEPDVLKALNPLPKDAPHNRLSFARWLVSLENPLTARVTVNRQWAAFFGKGIVRSVDDFGYQGDSPTHPALLDWLAVEFMKEGWSLKKIHKLIVMSATYQQSSRVSPELQLKDPSNFLLARAPRFRLDAEMIRDTLLRASGLLSNKIGGPSVFPPQQSNITTEGAYGGLDWKASQGEDRYRRGLYTFSKRTAPYAMFSTFDAPSGEACIARRDVSNTPLQALTMLNDTVILEIAQSLGNLIAREPGSAEQRAQALFRRCLTRPPSAEETSLLLKFFNEQKERFDRKELDPAILAGKGSGNESERAAWTALARTLLNLDEAITKG